MSRDILSDLLRAVRVRGAVFYYVSCSDPWSAEAPPAHEIAGAVMPGCEHVIEYHMIAKGNGWAAVSGEPPVRLASGDIAMFPQGDRHVLSSAPGIEPLRRTAEWVFSTRSIPKPMPIAYHHGVVEAGAPLPVEDADTIAVCGFLGCDLKPFNPLIAALPRILHLPAERASGWTNRVIEQAVVESNTMLERLAEMMFVDAARRYLDSLPEDATGWLAGLRDRFVGKALELMHERPDRNWTVDDIAREVGLSRSALHGRFVQYLGDPPMHYLANWRIQLGSTLLRETNRTVAAVALDVGYESEAAFSRAFKRMVGMPPAAWKKAQAGRKMV
ncbi:MAG: AraC family transcriptional regulator [Xanthomonadaceae bacterium]|nr:AraC family transcriptional regulator [Xanthomonadaceae bacterium]